MRIGIIGFGEAGSTFGHVVRAGGAAVRAFDRKGDLLADAYDAAGVTGAASPQAALEGARAVLSLVTADEALEAARAYARHLAAGALWLDMNSVAPDTKRDAARAVEAAGGRYVDVAVMSPVLPGRAKVPLLLSGPHADAAAGLLRDAGFRAVRVLPGDIGRASAVKMIRSVIVKGIEALTAECVLAADAADVLDEVLASLDASPPPPAWAERADYNLDRMIVHGARRAAEMEEVVRTLDALGTGSAMARATVARQRAIGTAAIACPDGLAAKLAALRSFPRKDAA